MKVNFRKMVKKEMKRQKMTQRELSRRTGITTTDISLWLTGKKKSMLSERIELIFHELNITMDNVS